MRIRTVADLMDLRPAPLTSAPTNKIGWLSALTRERQVCRICFNAGVRPSVPLVPFAENLVLLRKHHGSFNAKRKAALKAHVKAAHPEWFDRIAWDRK